MVDLRPLLFINSLMLLLLLAAGFVFIGQSTETNTPKIAETIPTETESSSNQINQSKNATDPQKGLDKSKQVLAALRETEEASFAQEPIFADEKPLEKISLDDKSTSSSPPVTPSQKEAHEEKVVAFVNTPPPKSQSSQQVILLFGPTLKTTLS